MIGGLIVIYLYTLIGLWLVAMAYKHAVAIDEFSLRRWITGSSHSAVWFKGSLFVAVLIGGSMIVGYLEFLGTTI